MQVGADATEAQSPFEAHGTPQTWAANAPAQLGKASAVATHAAVAAIAVQSDAAVHVRVHTPQRHAAFVPQAASVSQAESQCVSLPLLLLLSSQAGEIKAKTANEIEPTTRTESFVHPFFLEAEHRLARVKDHSFHRIFGRGVNGVVRLDAFAKSRGVVARALE